MKNALDLYLTEIKKDYLKWSPPGKGDEIQQKVRDESVARFFSGLRYKMGSMYIKVISGNGVHSFIVREDGPKFKKGDILKAATWRAPALNQARGNIFGEYHISWTGADYLKSGRK